MGNYLNFYYFMSVETLAREYFKKGHKARKVYELLSDNGIKCSVSSIRHYHTAYSKGFPSHGAYNTHLAREKGFRNRYEQFRTTKEIKDFEEYSEVFIDIDEYRMYTGDDNFMAAYNNENINRENPFTAIPILDPECDEVDWMEGPEDVGYVQRGIEILTELERI